MAKIKAIRVYKKRRIFGGGPFSGGRVWSSDLGNTLPFKSGEYEGRYVNGEWVSTKKLPLFVMKGYEPELINTYDCDHCQKAGIEHEVVNVKGEDTGEKSRWGEGLPTTMRKCTACGLEDGPWVSADIVGGGW